MNRREVPGHGIVEELEFMRGRVAKLEARLAEQGEEVARLRRNRERFHAQQRVLARLTGSEPHLAHDLPATYRLLTETVAGPLAVDSMGLWQFNDDHTRLRCLELYRVRDQRHCAGMEMGVGAHPAYLQALGAGEALVVDDVYSDARTAEIPAGGQHGGKVAAIMDIPVFVNRRLEGVLRCERLREAGPWTPEDRLFGIAAAGLVTLAAQYAGHRGVEETLRQGESKYRALIETTDVDLGLWDWNIHTGEVLFNERWARRLGYAAEEIAPHIASWHQLVHPDDMPAVQQALDAHLEGRCAYYESEHRLRTRGGGWVWILDRGKVVERDQDGRPARATGTQLDITDRKQAEATVRRLSEELELRVGERTAQLAATNEALRESEARWQFALEGAGDGIWDWDIPTNRVFSSDQLIRMLGFEPREWNYVLQQWDSRLHPEDREHVWEAINRHLNGDSPVYSTELRILNKQGQYIWILDRGKVISRDEDGRPLRMIGTHTDITERKRMELELQDTNAMLQTLSAAQARFISDEDPRDSFARLLNQLLLYTQSEYGFIGELATDADGQPCLMVRVTSNIAGGAGTPALDEQHAGSGREFRNLNALIGTVLRTGQPVIANDPPRVEGADGDPSLNAFLGLPFHHAGELIGMVGVANCRSGYDPALAARLEPLLTTCASMVGSYRNSLRRREAEEALRLSEANLAAAQAIAHLGSWELELGTAVDGTAPRLRWSEETYRIFGHPAEVGITADLFYHAVHPEDREHVYGNIEQASREGTRYSIEYRIRRPDGSERLVHEQSNLVRDPVSGRIVKMVGTVQDVTERKLAEAQIRKLNEKLEERVRQRTAELEAANRELESFSYSVSHDLRAPLRGIDGWSLALLEDFRQHLPAPAQHYLVQVREEAQRMAELIDDLLQLSRVTRSDMRHEAVDLSAVAHEITASLQQRHPERRVEAVIQAGVSVNGDPVLLRLILQNLFDNAWKFTAKHGSARIEFGTQNRGGRIAYFVGDDGAGFDMRYARKLFNPFQRLHRANDFPGTGIGLATVQRIIRRHGGRIWAEGAVEKGATFLFTLSE